MTQDLTLVTGATGTVGFNIVQSLIKRGRTVRVLVRSIERAQAVLPSACEFVEGDICDYDSVKQAMQGCSVVHHAAGLPEQWFRDPDIFTRVNVIGTQNMLRAALEHSVAKFVYTSTIDVFQAGRGEHYDESTLDSNPKGTYYERSKQQADHFVTQAIEQGLDAVFIHPAGVYGPGPDIEHAVGLNDIIHKSYHGQLPALLPGGFPLVYSEDVGEAHVLAEQAQTGERFIVSERYLSLTEMVAEVYRELGMNKRLPIVLPTWLGKALASVGERVANVINKPPLVAKGEFHFLQWQAIPNGSKVQRELGVRLTPFDEGLKHTISAMFGRVQSA